MKFLMFTLLVISFAVMSNANVETPEFKKLISSCEDKKSFLAEFEKYEDEFIQKTSHVPSKKLATIKDIEVGLHLFPQHLPSNFNGAEANKPCALYITSMNHNIENGKMSDAVETFQSWTSCNEHLFHERLPADITALSACYKKLIGKK